MKFKRLLSSILIVILMVTLFIPGAAVHAEELISTASELDKLDIMISANSALRSPILEDSILDKSSSLKEIVALYNTQGDIVAFYTSFSPKGYSVINNNQDNPTAIEFGDGDNQFIREILNTSPTSRIIYNSPVDVYTTSAYRINSVEDADDLYTNYPELNIANESVKALHEKQREAVLNQITVSTEKVTIFGGSYGFIDWDSMPSGSYTSGYIPFGGTSWCTTGENSDIANNHCGATAATNIALYYANRGYTNLKKNNSKRDTFVAVHDIIGDGPVMMIAGGTKDYFSSRGYTLKYSSVGTFSGIKTATSNNRPCGILLASGIVDWHWIVSTGWREYTTGGKYIRIVDGWSDYANNFYLINDSALWISATEYWIG
ncbi:hypothetical protein R2R35_02715 [Anaerocolumna sp. AGMB13020]|uniref:hypothetical protein n=1 Tax=Anaerocolumna sp. AGMB13020 TaxID=3081750 RepID=UPI002955A68C|nr:hypothetical protein [Anaerocolumna sp. AGMB13020]WOO37424.1 hypothetical protein R2R35_02715 [Anaerocolumna sp. AGMB13020]